MTIALVAGSGGHLKQLHMISGELRGFKTWWITDLNDQSASLLEGEKVTWLPRSRPRQLWKVLLNAVTLARTFDSSCSSYSCNINCFYYQ